jgi:hypothetical protein
MRMKGIHRRRLIILVALIAIIVQHGNKDQTTYAVATPTFIPVQTVCNVIPSFPCLPSPSPQVAFITTATDQLAHLATTPTHPIATFVVSPAFMGWLDCSVVLLIVCTWSSQWSWIKSLEG